MSKESSRRPTEAEFEILTVLWNRGPSTVRQVFENLQAHRNVGYTTVLKLMQIMADKGLIERDASVRPQIFTASSTREQTEQQEVTHLMSRVFRGSPGRLAIQALTSQKTTSEERRMIRELLDRLEGEDS